MINRLRWLLSSCLVLIVLLKIQWNSCWLKYWWLVTGPSTFFASTVDREVSRSHYHYSHYHNFLFCTCGIPCLADMVLETTQHLWYFQKADPQDKGVAATAPELTRDSLSIPVQAWVMPSQWAPGSCTPLVCPPRWAASIVQRQRPLGQTL